MSRNLNIWDVSDELCTDEAEFPSSLASRRRVAGAIRSLVCRLCVLGSYMSYCSCLFLCMIVIKCYGSRRRGLELGLYTTSEVCYVSGEWIKSRIHG